MSLVSIITPVYNSESYLAACLESVKQQTHVEWEHILVDDCSVDRSAEIIEKYAAADPRIKYIRLEENSGAGIARNKGIEVSKGDFIAFLDSDDLWYPEKLRKQLYFMLENGYFFTFTSYDKMDDQGIKVTGQVRVKPKITYKKALYKNPIGCLTAMYDRRFYGKEYMPKIRKRQDYALWLKLLKRADAYGLDEILSSYRERSGSISSNKLGLIKYEWYIYREHEQLSVFRSLFYVLSAIVFKMKNYF